MSLSANELLEYGCKWLKRNDPQYVSLELFQKDRCLFCLLHIYCRRDAFLLCNYALCLVCRFAKT